jgi:phenylpyruvate tautomerase PptA (4-oxalocrotonate tautomerase family)
MPIVTLTVRKPKSIEFKAQVLGAVHVGERLSCHGLDPENLMVVFQDVPWENFSPAGGRVPHA